MNKNICTFICLFFTFTLFAQFHLTLETGVGFNAYNDVKAPNETGVRASSFSLTDDFEPEQPNPFFRLCASYIFGDRHVVAFTAAPLQFMYEKNDQKEPIYFEEKTFADYNSPLLATYEFNTYRLSYRYRIINKENLKLGLGITGLLRDAKIKLTQNNFSAKNTDLGFVPLISFNFEATQPPLLTFVINGDALVGPQGRAEDIFTGIDISIIEDHLKIRLGYRLLEGGANVDQVYNFTLFHFVNFGFVYRS